MLSIARALDGIQLVLLCGRNEALADRLRKLRRGAPHAVFGFTDDVTSVLRLGDFFIGKPGPGALSEAVHLADLHARSGAAAAWQPALREALSA